MMQIIRQPSDWTKVSRGIVCHEPSGLLFEIMPGRGFTATDAAPPDRLCAKSFVLGSEATPPAADALEALSAEAVLMILFFDRYVVPRDVTPREQANAA